jgi:cytochrome c oxidase assembly protein subunit 11
MRGPADRRGQTGANHRDLLVGFLCGGMVAAMIGASFAAVPFYSWFCRTTGYGGTTQVSKVAPAQISDRTITVRFDSNVAAVGQAGYNVSPPTAGIYFEKINCFCFTEQTMRPGEKRDMAVVFYVDPKLAADSEQDGLNLITLSYTFYPVRPALAPAHADAEKDQAVAGSAAAEKSGRI